ncbi:MAG: hypothetical protein NWF01_02265 [Candidatus Bathyarchaeota archaeon]|nr:hypothetical protein [Candidatus Bathyarchaeota archaeon]
MSSSTMIANENQESPDIKKAIIIVLLVSIAIFAIILVGMTLTKPAQDGNPTTLTFALYQSVTYNHNDTNYELKYEPAGQANLLIVNSQGQSFNYPAVAGAAYDTLGIRVTIISATQELIVVHVAPLENETT